MRDLLRRLLSREGYDVDVIDGGAGAVDLARSRFYDLVLMDLKMPRMKGPEAIRAMSSLSPRTQYLVITGHVVPQGHEDSLGELDRLVLEGRFNFVFKPFRNEVVVSRIKTMLDSSQPALRGARPGRSSNAAMGDCHDGSK